MNLKYKIGLSILVVGAIAVIVYLMYKAPSSDDLSADNAKTVAANDASANSGAANSDSAAKAAHDKAVKDAIANNNMNEKIAKDLADQKAKTKLYGYGRTSWFPVGWDTGAAIGPQLQLSDKDCAIKCRDTPTCMSATRFVTYPGTPGFEKRPCQLYNKSIDNSKVRRIPQWDGEIFVRSNTIPAGATLVNF